jgi:hypothetical protein
MKYVHFLRSSPYLAPGWPFRSCSSNGVLLHCVLRHRIIPYHCCDSSFPFPFPHHTGEHRIRCPVVFESFSR